MKSVYLFKKEDDGTIRVGSVYELLHTFWDEDRQEPAHLIRNIVLGVTAEITKSQINDEEYKIVGPEHEVVVLALEQEEEFSGGKNPFHVLAKCVKKEVPSFVLSGSDVFARPAIRGYISAMTELELDDSKHKMEVERISRKFKQVPMNKVKIPD